MISRQAPAKRLLSVPLARHHLLIDVCSAAANEPSPARGPIAPEADMRSESKLARQLIIERLARKLASAPLIWRLDSLVSAHG